MIKRPVLGSLFDGIGAFPYAASLFGIKTLWASEILPAAVSVTRRHFPDMAHVGDVTKLDGALLPPVDIIAFGSPCQDLSQAAGGKRAGLAGERSGLFMEAIRIINEMREATDGKYPRYAIFENVPGCFSSNGRRDYKAVLEAFTGRNIPMPRSDRWRNAGMVRSERVNLAWCVYDARRFGLAQRRKRVFLVADFRKGRPEEILLVPKSLPRHFTKGGAPGEGTAAAFENGAGDAGGIGFDGYNCGLTGGFAATMGVNCGTSTGRNGILQGPGMRRGAEREDVLCAATGQSGTEILNGRSPTLNCNHEQPYICKEQPTAYGICSFASHSMTSDNPRSGCYEADSARTLDSGGGNPACHQGGIAVVAFNGGASPQAGSIAYSDRVSPTLKAASSGLRTPCVCEPDWGPREVPQGLCGGRRDNGADKLSRLRGSVQSAVCPDVARTLTARGDSSPCADRGQNIVIHPEIAGTLCASAAGLSRPAGMVSETDLTVAYCLQGNMIGRKDSNGPAGKGVNEGVCYTLNGTDHHAVAVDCRNLKESGEMSGTLQAKTTPGYSLNYMNPVRVGYIVRRLTPTECEALMGFERGYTAFGHDGKEISDSRRYSMLGNSIATPCAAYILQGILEQYAKEDANWK